ncbi:uncharacterized protein EI97DRAFT_472961 [Westerdykella ornata]|uniref:Uncharacterized protein n=1 Tax=Westerdykella ornata TaxID=318751 RepID=A0A6A6JZ41_WESOR|nr:uncharacterized protein EI97DRAFT_472961 [Westerdykella ornata]KAF2281475.1 hypothetical protein EI97DRAFT_472961 [Westerdykella ornata]
MVAEAAAPSPKYLRLAPKRKRIPQEIIEKWPMISAPVLDQISVVLRRAKDAIVLSRRDPQKQQEADEVLHGVIRKLERHFANTKIPPQSKAHQFDLNHIAAQNERVYRELTTTRHRNQLLDEQIKIAAAKLKEEEETLSKVKENKLQWQRRWKAQGKKQLHPLLQEAESLKIVEDKPEDIGLRKAPPIDTALFDISYADLAPLLQTLRLNLETMQNNHAQIGGISDAVTEAQVALDDVVFKHVQGEQYDALMNY